MHRFVVLDREAEKGNFTFYDNPVRNYEYY